MTQLHFTILFGAIIGQLSAFPTPEKNATLKLDFPGGGPYQFDYLLGDDSFIENEAEVVFLDYDAPKAVMDRYKAKGIRVICYVNVGAWEEWRSDADDFPESVLGNDYEGWPGERWLDVRATGILIPLMRARYQVAISKGCEGIDPDNMNGWLVNTGFPLSYAHSLNFNRAVSNLAHNLGILAGLKNANEMADDLMEDVDFAVLESCVKWDECHFFNSYPSAGKPVFVIEYTEYWSESVFRRDVCPLVEETRMAYILKHYELHGDFIVTCPIPSDGGQRTYLRANGDSAGTYNLLNSVLGGTAYEVPDCGHPVAHITQRNDTELGIPVFNFAAHVEFDDDRCVNSDRQRTEIKSTSPDSLICWFGDSVSYSWSVRLNSAFAPSTAFTHIFQVKAVDGDDSQPFITITPRLLANGTKVLQVIHSGANSSPVTLWEEPLATYAGRWIHITTEYKCSNWESPGRFHMRMKRLESGEQLMSITHNDIEMWRDGVSFLRPKWGIYRSLNDRANLRDEFVYFNNFCLGKGTPLCD